MEFVVFNKALDLMEMEEVVEALNESRYTRLIHNIYKNAAIVVQVNDNTYKIKIQRDVRQGKTLSLKLFISTQAYTFQTVY